MPYLSRRAAVGAFGILGVAAAAGYAWQRQVPAPRKVPKLFVSKAPAKTRTAKGLGALVLTNLPDGKRRALLSDLEEAVASGEARTHPLLEDFLELDADAVAKEHQPALLPLVTAARALLKGSWPLPEGGAIGVVPHDEQSVEVTAWGKVKTELEPVRRFAWPVVNALRLRLSTSSERAAAFHELRQHSTDRNASTGVCVDLESLQKRIPDAADFQKLARRANIPMLEFLRNVDLERPEFGWLELDVLTLWVVPKLGKLASRERFVDEVQAVARRVANRFDVDGA
jgi:hypothetical protein